MNTSFNNRLVTVISDSSSIEPGAHLTAGMCIVTELVVTSQRSSALSYRTVGIISWDDRSWPLTGLQKNQNRILEMAAHRTRNRAVRNLAIAKIFLPAIGLKRRN
jgi:hypothetical protein